jgi:RimJ/RimL family protein N-acetyltransferase
VIEDSLHHVVGVITHFKSRTPVTREIGYRLFDPKLAGRGYVTEACSCWWTTCSTLTYHRLELLTAPENVASVRIAQNAASGPKARCASPSSSTAITRRDHLQLAAPEWKANL